VADGNSSNSYIMLSDGTMHGLQVPSGSSQNHGQPIRTRYRKIPISVPLRLKPQFFHLRGPHIDRDGFIEPLSGGPTSVNVEHHAGRVIAHGEKHRRVRHVFRPPRTVQRNLVLDKVEPKVIRKAARMQVLVVLRR